MSGVSGFSLRLCAFVANFLIFCLLFSFVLHYYKMQRSLATKAPRIMIYFLNSCLCAFVSWWQDTAADSADTTLRSSASLRSTRAATSAREGGFDK